VESLILETTFVIDLEREHNREVPGKAVRFLETHADSRLYLTFTVLGELACGNSLDDREPWEAFVRPFFVLASNAEVSWHFGATYRHLRRNGQLIGANDLWIAATALAYDMPVVTSNVTHYRRVPGLTVVKY